MEDFAAAAPQPPIVEHPFEPIVVNRPPLAAKATLKIVAFNAQSGRHLGGIIRCLQRPSLRGADIILLSEVDWQHPRSHRRQVAAELAAELGLSFVFAAEFGPLNASGSSRWLMGNAILSSRPLTDVTQIPLPRLYLRARIRRLLGAPTGLSARISVNGEAIAVGVAHLNSRWDPSGRELQMREYLAGFPPDGPAVIGGDFNTTTIDLRHGLALVEVARHVLRRPWRFRAPEPWEPLFKRLAEADFSTERANAPGKPTFTFNRAIPPLIRPKLDWIALRGLRARQGSAAVVPARASFFSPRVSDHDFVVCEVRL